MLPPPDHPSLRHAAPADATPPAIAKTTAPRLRNILRVFVAVLFFGVGGDVVGQEVEIYSTGFETGFTTGTDYQSTVTSGPTNEEWTTYYGTPTTTQPITDNISMQMRLYSNGNIGYTHMDFDLEHVSRITFNARWNSSSVQVRVEYSIDGGSNWLNGEVFTLTNSTTNYEYIVSEIGEFETIRIKFTLVGTAPTNGNKQLIIDDIVFYGISPITTPTLIPTPTTLPNLTYMEGAGPSASESFALTGVNLDPESGNITVAATADFEVSEDEGGTYTNNLIIPYTGGTLSTTEIYVRLAAGLTEDIYSGDVEISGGDAPPVNVSLDGEVTPFVSFCGLENFNNSNLTASYEDGSFVGNDGITWTYGHSRNEGNGGDLYSIDGNGIMLRRASDSYLEVTLPNGVETFSFDYRKAFTGGSDRQLELLVNGVQVATTPTFGSGSGEDATIHHFSHDVMVSGPVTLRIKNVGSTTSNRQTVLDNISWTCITECSPDPMEDQATFHENSPFFLESTSAQLRWTNGDGDRRIVVVREGAAVNANPTNGLTYSANSSFGLGDEIGSGNFVVYNGSGNQVDLIGLTPGTEYFTRIFEYTCPGDEVYLTALEEDVFITPPMVPTNFSMVCKGETSIDLTWSPPAVGNHDGYILVMREGANTPHAVTDLVPGSQTHNLNFGSAPLYGDAPSSRVLYIGNNTTATVTDLTNGNQYRFAVHTYTVGSSDHVYSTRTVTTQTIDFTEVDNLIADPSTTSMGLFWNINASCVDQIIVVASDDGAVTGTPSGSYTVNSNSVTDGTNPTIDGDVVVYAGTGGNVNVTGLTENTAYCFKVFVRKGGNWSDGREVCETARESTVLQPGDLAIVAVNTNIEGATPNSDEICFVAFKTISPGTTIDFTDNGYGRGIDGYWGRQEGRVRLALNESASAIPAGTVVCLNGQGAASNFSIFVCGSPAEDAWTITSSGAFSSFNLNSSDQVWILQGGEWVDDASDENKSYYTGNVLYGWTATGWKSDPGFDNSSGSMLFPSTECFSTKIEVSGNQGFVKYTGPTTPAHRVEWMDRIGTEENWTTYPNSAEYYANGPDYRGSCDPELDISSTGSTPGLWNGEISSDWFDCRNWDNRVVPDATTDVVIQDESFNPEINAPGAECRDLILDTGTEIGVTLQANGELSIYGNVNRYTNFVELDGTIYFRGSGNQYFGHPDYNGHPEDGNTYDVFFNKLVMDKPSGKLYTTDRFVIDSELEFESGGIIVPHTSINTVQSAGFEMSHGSITVGASNEGFVVGKIRKRLDSQNYTSDISFTFPIGDTTETGNAWYQPVRISGPNPSSYLNGTYNAQYFAHAHPEAGTYYNGQPYNNGEIGKCDHWVVTKGDMSADVQLAFKYTNEDEEYCNVVGDPTALQLAWWNNIDQWLEVSGIDLTEEGWIKRQIASPDSDYGAFALASTVNANVLPIELLEFSARPDGGAVMTHWVTATETNNDYFTVERSDDGRDFHPVGTVSGAGFSNVRLEYDFTDLQPLSGVSYYRLRQTDFDGGYSFGPVRAVKLDDHGAFGIEQVYRGEGGIELLYRSPAPLVVIEIFNVLGQRVFHVSEENRNGQSRITATLERGVYLLRLSDQNGNAESRKFFY